jgi:hypothetical protein
MPRFSSRRSGRVLWLERRFDLLAQTVGFDLMAVPALAPVIAELNAGREIKAAQVYQAAFGCPLVEAAAAVEALKARLGPS